MQVSVADAQARLRDLVRRAQAGDEVVLTDRGMAAVRLVPVVRRKSPEERRRIIAEIQAEAREKMTPGPCAARSQDFLYDEDGLPA